MSLPFTCAIKSCTAKDACSCESDEGLIDLRPLDVVPGPAFPSIADTLGQWTYSYNPCTPFTLDPYYCPSAAICQKSTTSSESYLVGTHNPVTFSVDPTGQLTATYLGTGWDMQSRTGVIKLVCDSNTEKNMVFNSDIANIYTFTLTTQYACPGGGGSRGSGGLSAGSVLCIILTVLIVVYLVGGVLFMTYNKGATGVERIPNVDFWKELPGLVKDGVLFTVRCGKGSAAYDEI